MALLFFFWLERARDNDCGAGIAEAIGELSLGKTHEEELLNEEWRFPVKFTIENFLETGLDLLSRMIDARRRSLSCRGGPGRQNDRLGRSAEQQSLEQSLLELHGVAPSISDYRLSRILLTVKRTSV